MYFFNFEKLEAWKKSKSMMECFNQVLIAGELNFINNDDIELIRKETNIISYMLIKLRDSIK
jgi:hypothetical protein